MIFDLKNKPEIINFLKHLEKKGAEKVEIKEIKKKRCIEQNALYWVWLKTIADDTGEGIDDLHEVFKIKFLGKEIFGKFESAKSSTNLDISEFAEYMQKVEAFAESFLNIRLQKRY